MSDVTICPQCLTLGEVQRRPVAGTVWAVLAGLLVVVGAIGAWPAMIVGAVFGWLAGRCFRRVTVCPACGGAAMPVGTPGGQDAWARLKARKRS